MATATRLDAMAERLDGVGGPIGSSGPGTAGQVLYWADAVNATSEAAFSYNASTNKLSVAALDLTTPLDLDDVAFVPCHTLYVDGARADTYTADGSIATPYKTVKAALDWMNADIVANGKSSYVVYVAKGTYSDNLTITGPSYLRVEGQGAVISGTILINSGVGSYDRIEFKGGETGQPDKGPALTLSGAITLTRTDDSLIYLGFSGVYVSGAMATTDSGTWTCHYRQCRVSGAITGTLPGSGTPTIHLITYGYNTFSGTISGIVSFYNCSGTEFRSTINTTPRHAHELHDCTFNTGAVTIAASTPINLSADAVSLYALKARTPTLTNVTYVDLDHQVDLQGSTPGTAQSGHINVTGTVIAGAKVVTPALGGDEAATDAAPAERLVQGQSAWSQATVNTAGANARLAGGLGRRFFTIVGNVGLATKAVTLMANGTAVSLTAVAGAPGANEFGPIGTDDTAPQLAVTATALAAAINGHATFGPLMTAVPSAANVYLDKAATCYDLYAATGSAGALITATAGTDGVVAMGGPITHQGILFQAQPSQKWVLGVAQSGDIWSAYEYGGSTRIGAYTVDGRLIVGRTPAGGDGGTSYTAQFKGSAGAGSAILYVEAPGNSNHIYMSHDGTDGRIASDGLLGISGVSSVDVLTFTSPSYVTRTSTSVDGLTLYVPAIRGSKSKALTDATPTDFATFTIADGETHGGKIIYTVKSTKGTALQRLEGEVRFSATREGSTYTVVVGTTAETASQVLAAAAGTLTGGVTIAGAAGVVTLTATFDTSQSSPDAMTFEYRFDSTDASLAITPL